MELEQTLETLRDAGCTDEEMKRAKLLHEAGDIETLVRYLRICRCSRMEELHESQRKVDCLDYLIRQAAGSGKRGQQR